MVTFSSQGLTKVWGESSTVLLLVDVTEHVL